MRIKNILNIKKKRFWIGILLVQFFLFFGLSKIDFAVEFFSDLFEYKKFTQQYMASQLPFSIGDVLYIGLGLILILSIFKLFRKEKRNQSALKLLMILNSFYFIYQIFWGMLYFQVPLINKLSEEKISIDEAKVLSKEYLEICISNRKKVKEDKEGVFKIENNFILEKELLEAQKNLPKHLIQKKYVEVNSLKPSIFKFVMSYTGIMGYYNPFTSEAQYNSELPDTYLPFTMAHESSHQLGYAKEQEANFVGFLIGENSENAELKYSTDLFALKSLLRYIQMGDEAFVQNLIDHFSEGMKRDLKFERNFNEKHAGFLDDFFAVTNNLFLKSNQQEGSITYSYFTEILIKYKRNK
ncbi:DUF3810 domain-containing protein [Frigoriflavimonas asaccharolytica]